MNVERWALKRRVIWHRLEELLTEIEKQGLTSLSGDKLRELGKLYRSASADLSRARAVNIGGEIQIYLNNLVVKAHNQVYQRRQNRWKDLWEFFWITFPATVRQNVVYVAVAIALFCVPLIGSYLFVLADPEFAHMEVAKGQPLVSEKMWNLIEHKQMWTDSAQLYSPAIAGMIGANNIKVAIFAFAFGITFGFGTVYILFLNGLMLGTTFGACEIHGMAHRLWAFVAPHGVLELMAIFISGGAGLLIGKALLFPGNWRRVDALRKAAGPAFKMFGGCVPMLLIACLIEGFISPRTDLGPEVKFLISIGTALLLGLYLLAPRQSKSS